MGRNKSIITLGGAKNNLLSPTYVDGRHLDSYTRWRTILTRCYSEKKQITNPTYIGCTVCDEWLLFSNFKKWFDENNVEGFDIDKDILVKGNKVYSPDTCRFVPKRINHLINHKKSKNLGIKKNGNGFSARVSDGVTVKHIGTYKTMDEAKHAYVTKKKEIIDKCAIEMFLDGQILSDIASALINYTIQDS